MSRPLPADIQLATIPGQHTTLGDALQGGPGVVLFWSHACPASRGRMPEFDALARRLEDSGVRVVGLTRDGPSDAGRAYAEERSFPSFRDVHGHATRAFGMWATPQIFVVDHAGVLRFEFTSIGAVPRQLLALGVALLDHAGEGPR